MFLGFFWSERVSDDFVPQRKLADGSVCVRVLAISSR